MTLYIDESIRTTERAFPDQGRYGYLRYDMNENPEGLPKEFVDSVLAEITPEFLAIYPEPDVFLRKYAEFVGAGFQNVVATNGSDMAIRYLLEIFCGKGHEVVTVAPSFEMYGVNCSVLGLTHVPVQYKDDLTMDVEKIVDAIGPQTDVVVLLNPNNPVGNVYSEDEAKRIVRTAQENNALVIVDEAYHYFYGRTFIDLALSEPNVALLRTFSKLFSIAACRLGLIIANENIIKYVKNAKLTFDANAIALKFGERILENPELVKSLIDTERLGREHTLDCLSRKGYEVRDCKGNFIFVRSRRKPEDVAHDLRVENKILVKYWQKGLLAPYLRVSTGSIAAMDRFIEPFLEIDGR